MEEIGWKVNRYYLIINKKVWEVRGGPMVQITKFYKAATTFWLLEVYHEYLVALGTTNNQNVLALSKIGWIWAILIFHTLCIMQQEDYVIAYL